MISVECLRERLESSLQGLVLEMKLEVVKNDRYMYFITITSPMFESMDEADRQSLVWDRVLNRLTPSEWTHIEFIFTYAPSELENESTEPVESIPRNE